MDNEGQIGREEQVVQVGIGEEKINKTNNDLFTCVAVAELLERAAGNLSRP